MGLALAACGGTPSASPAVTVTQTVTVTETVTAEAAEPSLAVDTPSAKPPAAEAPAIPTLPSDVAGTNAQALSDDLEALGYEHIVWNSDTGKTVILLANWTVVSLEKAGEKVPTSKTIVVHVTKP